MRSDVAGRCSIWHQFVCELDCRKGAEITRFRRRATSHKNARANLRGHEQFRDVVARMEAHVARQLERVEAEGIAFVVDSVIAAAGIERRDQR